MRAYFETFLSIIFPKSDDAILVDELHKAEVRGRVLPHRNGDVTTLLQYRDPVVRALIQEAKFYHNKRALELLGAAFSEYLEMQEYDSSYIFIPMPLSPARMRERGYNQVLEMLRSANIDEAQIETAVLERVRNTKPQTELSKEKRIKNVAGAFSLQNEERIEGKRIVLVDDVFTTGATMEAARAELARLHPASLTCVALAH